MNGTISPSCRYSSQYPHTEIALVNIKRKGSQLIVSSSKNNDVKASEHSSKTSSSKEKVPSPTTGTKKRSPSVLSTGSHATNNSKSNMDSSQTDLNTTLHKKTLTNSQRKKENGFDVKSTNQKETLNSLRGVDNTSRTSLLSTTTTITTATTTKLVEYDDKNNKNRTTPSNHESSWDEFPKGSRSDSQSLSLEKLSTTTTTTTTATTTTATVPTNSSIITTNKAILSNTELVSEENVTSSSNHTDNSERTITKNDSLNVTLTHTNANQTQYKPNFLQISSSFSTKRMKKISGSSTTTTTGTEITDRSRDPEIELKRLTKIDVWSAGVVLYVSFSSPYPSLSKSLFTNKISHSLSPSHIIYYFVSFNINSLLIFVVDSDI